MKMSKTSNEKNVEEKWRRSEKENYDKSYEALVIGWLCWFGKSLKHELSSRMWLGNERRLWFLLRQNHFTITRNYSHLGREAKERSKSHDVLRILILNFFVSWCSKQKSFFPLELFEINKSNKFSVRKVMQIKKFHYGTNIVRDIIYYWSSIERQYLPKRLKSFWNHYEDNYF